MWYRTSLSDNSVSLNESVIDAVNRYIKSGITSMEAIKLVAKERKVPKSDIYKEYQEAIKKWN